MSFVLKVEFDIDKDKIIDFLKYVIERFNFQVIGKRNTSFYDQKYGLLELYCTKYYAYRTNDVIVFELKCYVDNKKKVLDRRIDGVYYTKGSIDEKLVKIWSVGTVNVIC